MFELQHSLESTLRTCSWLGSVCCLLLSKIFLTESSRSKTCARLLSTATSTRQESGISVAADQKGRNKLICSGSSMTDVPFSRQLLLCVRDTYLRLVWGVRELAPARHSASASAPCLCWSPPPPVSPHLQCPSRS